MRSIIFRAKTLSTKKWVYGNYINQTSKTFIKNYDVEANSFIHTIEQDATKDMLYGIDVETLGEFTGLKDKNGTDIYEGDIVLYRGYETRFIFYGICGFRHTMYEKYAKDLEPRSDYFEVVGNIYDNPELLKPNSSSNK